MSLACPCADVGCLGKELGMLDEDVRRLAHDLTDIGATITSGLRCPEHNRAVGGEPRSKHVLGMALDFVPPAGKPRMDLVLPLLEEGKWRVITYSKDDHVHVQIDVEPRLYVADQGRYVRVL